MDEKSKKRLISRSNIKKGNVRCITITDNIPEHWDNLITIAKSYYDFWAYIYHDRDTDRDNHIIGKHLHLLCFDKGGTTLKSHCGRFEGVVHPNFVEKVRAPRAMARYLIHLDDPEKFQYSRDDVITNHKDRYASYLCNHDADIVIQFQDFLKLIDGKITIYDYLDKYRGEFATMPFYQKQAFFHKISTSFMVRKSMSHPSESSPVDSPHV